jgi:bifunctional UDP-N-acetylglucosamine pyrophosphorylase/glucosamine-1-phosphate N-acetyltransferase
MVEEYVKNRYAVSANAEFAEQAEQLGTGHAVQMAKNNLQDFDGNTLILCGDVPKLSAQTLKAMAEEHTKKESDLTVLTAIAENPHGYGRIIKNSNAEFVKIVEEKDANVEEKAVKEINSGTYLVDNKALFQALDNISNENAQGEYYLTDIVGIFKKEGRSIDTYLIDNFDEIIGINSMDDLQAVEKAENDEE